MAFPYDADEQAAIARLAALEQADLANGGHITTFVPRLNDLADAANAVSDAAAAASASAGTASTEAAAAAASAAKLYGTSTTSVAIGLGEKSFVTQSGKFFEVGRTLRAASSANPTIDYMVGRVTSYSGTALTVDVVVAPGSGAHTDWLIYVEGEIGSAGTIEIDAVTRLAPGSTPTVSNEGTPAAASLAFGLPDGAPAGLRFLWSTDATSTDPTAGKVKVSSASLTAATFLYISETDADARTVAALIAEWDKSTSAVRGEIRLLDPVTPANFVVYRIIGDIVDNGGWDTVPVEHVEHGGTLTNGMTLYIQDKVKGDEGQPGTPGAAATIAIGSVTTGAAGSSAAVENVGTSAAAVLDFTIPRGQTGATGPVVAIRYAYSTTTTAADPGPGVFRFNSSTISSATALFIDDAEAGGATVTAWLDSFDDSTNTVSKGELTFVAVNDPTIWAKFKVTGSVVDSTSYRTVTISHINSNGTWTNGLAIGILFSAAGDKGIDGDGAGDTVGPAGATDGEFVLFDGVTGKLLKGGGAKVASNIAFTPAGSISASTVQAAIAEIDAEKQPLDGTLTALAALDASAGLLEQTGGDTFVKRAIGVGASDSVLTRADGDGRFLLQAGGTMTGPIVLAADASSAMHPVTKQQFDAGLLNMGRRQSVRVATTANITISTALNNGDTLDGVTLATGDLVLVKNQSTASQNGIYVVGTTPARSAEFDTYNEHAGSLIAVEEGTAGADTLWLCTSNRGGTLDTTAIAFTQLFFAAYTAGGGLSLTGDAFSINFGSANTWLAAQTFLNAGIKIQDTDASHVLTITGGSNLTANRSLTFTTGDADRSVTLGGNFSIGGAVSIANAFSTSGAFAITLTATAATNVTLPTSGTLATTSDIPAKGAGSDLRTGTDDAKYLTAKAIRDAFAFVALTDASTIAIDMATGFNFSVTLGGNRTLGAPTNSIAGQAGLILITQDGTGSRTLSFNSAWKFAGGTPTASTAAGTVDAIAYTVTTGGGSPIIRATYIKGFA